MPDRLLDLGAGLAIYRVQVDDLKEQEVNARAMTKQAFDRLAKTIGKQGRLESLPFCALADDVIEILSGHHRVRAARAAGLTTLHVIVDETGLDRSAIRSRQLAHNAIAGEDDPQLVARIYSAIEDVEARLESFIDPRVVEVDIPRVPLPPLDLGLEFRTVLLTFLPTQAERFDLAAEKVAAELSRDNDENWLADLELLERWQEVMRRVGREYEVRMMGAVMERIAAIVLDALGGDPYAADEEVVPLRDLFGASVIPKDAADVIQHAITALVKAGDVTEKARWRAVELLAADFIAGANQDG